jgi:molybdopterin synthase catalytic subunit
LSITAILEPERLDPRKELDALLELADGDGAIVSFVGLTRSRSNAGEQIDALVLDGHPLLTERSLHEIATAALERFEVSHVRIVHRTGTVRAREPIVFAGATSLHRRAAFEAADFLMDRLKTDAVLWKRELGQHGSRWVEPTAADYDDRKRWS